MYIFNTLLSVVITTVCCASIRKSNKYNNNACRELPETFLSEVLGPAFNSRYMSIKPPFENSIEESEYDGTNFKRTAYDNLDFYVDEDFDEQLSDEPAWKMRNHYTLSQQKVDSTSRRRKRSSRMTRQWDCESKVKWTDLGIDYFPRYLRSVECLAKSCWYGHYKCKPRSFTVKVLRRRRDKCNVLEPGTKIGTAGLPVDLRELWVWEERAVNFCCDCAL